MPAKSSDSVRVVYPRHNRETLVAELRPLLLALREVLPLRQVVLFGSWAAGRATAFSDIDLLVVYTGPRQPDAYQTVRRLLPLRGPRAARLHSR